jgi:uncharacterized RDD family membrane protein YckC
MLRADGPGGDAAEEGRRFVTVQAASSALAPAAIGARVVAFIIDAIVLALCQWAIGGIIGDVSIVGGVTRAIIYAAIGFLYFGYSWTAWQASPGQRVLGLMTVNDADGAALTWSQAAKRWAFLFGPSVLNSLLQFGALSALATLIVIGYGIYLLYTAATDPNRQGFHDKQAGTLVTVRAAA